MMNAKIETKKGLMNMFKMKKASRLLVGLVLVFSLASAPLAMAEDSAGMVVASRGEVIAVSDGGSRELKQGDFVYISDEIMTANRSFAVLQFVDGAKVTVRPDSLMIVETYVYNGDGNDAATLSLVSGGLRVITGAMAKTNPENYKVRTPVALMGVRGTEFSIMLCGDDVCDQEEMLGKCRSGPCPRTEGNRYRFPSGSRAKKSLAWPAPTCAL